MWSITRHRKEYWGRLSWKENFQAIKGQSGAQNAFSKNLEDANSRFDGGLGIGGTMWFISKCDVICSQPCFIFYFLFKCEPLSSRPNRRTVALCDACDDDDDKHPTIFPSKVCGDDISNTSPVMYITLCSPLEGSKKRRELFDSR